ncbi:MAG: hypothetical protein WD595_02040 [Waddliaceae bacterium]
MKGLIESLKKILRAIIPIDWDFSFAKKRLETDILQTLKLLYANLESVHNSKIEDSFELLSLIDLDLEIKRQLLAHSYRSYQHKSSFNKKIYLALYASAKKWLQGRHDTEHRSIDENDISALMTMARYFEFAKLAIQDLSLQKAAFEWALRDRLDIIIFILFPILQQKLVSSGLSARISRVNPGSLRHKNQQVFLLFEGEEVNILDEMNTITFRGNYTLTVGQIFDVFAQKDFKEGNLEYSINGVINWNIFKWGYWDCDLNTYQTLSLDSVDWWKQLPVVKIMTIQEAQKLYGLHLDGISWNLAVTANRSYTTLNPLSNHAFQEVAIPFDSKHYAIFAFGKFGTEIPESFSALNALPRMCAFVPATIAYPDPGYFHADRQFARYSYPLTKAHGISLMRGIAQDMNLGRKGKLFYQIQSENCAKWIHDMLGSVVGEENIPNLFFIHFLETEPVGIVAALFNTIKALPVELQTFVLTRLHYLLGASSKGVWVEESYISLCTTHFWENGSVYLPAYLHKQQESKNIGRVHLFKPVFQKVFERLRRRIDSVKPYGSFCANCPFKEWFAQIINPSARHMQFIPKPDLCLPTMRHILDNDPPLFIL